MQTFLPYPDFVKSAQCLDNKRLGKQRVEAKQILKINLLRIKNQDELIIFCNDCNWYSQKTEGWEFGCPRCLSYNVNIYKLKDVAIPWENHPAVLMWRGYEFHLAIYGSCICGEWIKRGYKDNLLVFFCKYLDEY